MAHNVAFTNVLTRMDEKKWNSQNKKKIMKTELTIISDDLNHGIITEKEARTLLLGLVAVSSSSGVIRTERGWPGHFICANRCRFRRNTLLTYNDIRIVVSTVGLMELDGKFETIGHNRHFETKAFHADKNDKRYFDADVSKQVYFDSEWAIAEPDADDRANEMHEAVVLEITNKLLAGETFPVTEW